MHSLQPQISTPSNAHGLARCRPAGFGCNGANASNPECDIANAATVTSQISADYSSVLAAINTRDDSYGTTCISCGLKKAEELAIAAARPGTIGPPVLILLTDGRQTVGGTDHTVTYEASRIKSQNMIIATVGFGDADAGLMTTWASEPSSTYALVGLADVVAARAAIPALTEDVCVKASCRPPQRAPYPSQRNPRLDHYTGVLPLPPQLLLPRGRVGRRAWDRPC